MKKTFKELCAMNDTFMSLLKQNPVIEHTKFGYAWTRFSAKNLDPILKEYYLALGLVRSQNALTDNGTGELLIDRESARGFKYNKEGFGILLKEEAKLEAEWNVKEYDVTPFICADVPPSLNEIQKETFEGTIINSKKK